MSFGGCLLLLRCDKLQDLILLVVVSLLCESHQRLRAVEEIEKRRAEQKMHLKY